MSKNNDKRRKAGIYPIPIATAAKQLGVTEGHLSRVVNGKRLCPPTLKRWHILLRKKGYQLPALRTSQPVEAAR